VTSLDELRNTLDQRAGLAPDPTGLVEQARAGAQRLRRRNRTRAIVAAVVAVGLALAAPTVVRSYAADPPPDPAGPKIHYREPYELSLQLAPGPVYFTMVHGTQGTCEWASIRKPSGSRPAPPGMSSSSHTGGWASGMKQQPTASPTG
jgi:hypothetical protein